VKTCKVCGDKFPSSAKYFYRNKNAKDGFYPSCKNCHKKSTLKYKTSIKKTKHKYYLQHKEETKDRVKQWVAKNVNRRRKIVSKYYNKNKDIIVKKTVEYWKNNREKIIKRRREFRLANHDAVLKKDREYYCNNRKKICASYKKRRHDNIGFRLLGNLRNALRRVVKSQGTIKSKRTMTLVGCSLPDLIRHLESLFLHGMSWNNYGVGIDKWSIDHVRPCASFDLTKPEEQKKCFHYTNMAPLWNPDQLSKSSRYQGRLYRLGVAV